MANKNIPTVLVIFGATGDLMSKKIIPALYHLYLKNKLPKLFQIIGFSRRDLTIDQFKALILEILKKHPGVTYKKESVEKFIRIISYHQGNFNHIDYYRSLAKVLGNIDGKWQVCSNKLFYLAVPPQYYKNIFNNLAVSGLTAPCSPEEGWTRVLVEKPFGKDLKTAEDLDLLLAKLFKEIQIYRIDHYLAKEMLQNILGFRFANNVLEQSWNNKFIEKIEIRLLESIGVEGRGTFYDGLGALRDVGQNHLLQMLALVTMDSPLNLGSETIRNARYQTLKNLRKLSLKEVIKHTIRAQYIGYNKIRGVKTNSKTETYFKVRAYLDSPRWQGVPIFMESGKRLKKQIKEIVITYKHSEPCFCPPGLSEHYKNRIVFQLEPKEQIKIYFLSKKPGLEMSATERSFNFAYRKEAKKTQYVEEYEKLLLDCIEGNQVLFISTNEVKEMWRYTDSIVKAWGEGIIPLKSYKPDTDKILKDARLIVEKPEISVTFKKEIGIVGLGKMGASIARQLMGKGWRVVGFNRTVSVARSMEKEGLIPAETIKELLEKLKPPRVIWLMVPAFAKAMAGKPAMAPVDEVIFKDKLLEYLDKGDIIVDAGNSYYKDAIRREKAIRKKGIHFIDVGVSGGPGGARYGACLMVGGDMKMYKYLLSLFVDMSVPRGVQFFEGVGAGHFVKMIHNGIEYGMMQALAEGFAILKGVKYKLDLKKVAEVYNHGSVIESRLVSWLRNAFEIYDDNLKEISGKVGYTGEGEWTVRTAKELNVKAKVIEDALKFRIKSQKKPSYIGQVLSALRNQFGGHKAKLTITL